MKLLMRRKLAIFAVFLFSLPVASNCRFMQSQAASTYSTAELASMAARMAPATGQAGADPELPRIFLDTRYVPPTGGQTINVSAGGDFQAAINRANPGDIISLQAGATFTGNFVLPAKTGTGWIVIRTSAPDSSLPAQGTRVTPAHASVMPKIITANTEPAITAANGAHHFRFIGVEVSLAAGNPLTYNLVSLSDGGQNTLDKIPHHLIFDRVYVHGNATATVRRGFALNSASTAIIDSYISDCHEVGADSQAIAGWNTPGPLKIVNNYLEGAGENFIMGGADPSVPNMVPSDIEFARNYCFKPTSWKAGEPDFGGIAWTVKNSFELKNAQRVLIDGNIFENNWVNAQTGFSILFTVRNQDGTAPWSVVQDITFSNNIVRHTASGLNMHGTDDIRPSASTRRVRISNNLFEDVGGNRWGGTGSGRLFQIGVGGGPTDVTIEHNTAFQTNHVAAIDGIPPGESFIFRNNIMPNNEFGFFGSGKGTGNDALNFYFPGAVFMRNVIVGGRGDLYPTDNFFPATIDAVRFVNYNGGNYQLDPSSPFKRAATDGKDIGVDYAALNLALTGIASVSTVSAASYSSDNVAIESILATFGTRISGTTQAAASTPLPTELDGVSVKVRDKFNVVWPCPLFFVSPTQINFQIPIISALGEADVIVTNADLVIARGTINVGRIAPGFFTADASGRGLPTAIVSRTRSNNQQTFEPVATYDFNQQKYVAVPIDLGPLSDQVFLVLYGTGFRYSSLSSFSVKIGGVDAQVTFAGQQGGFVGLDQLNIRMPRSLIGRGNVDVVVTVEGQTGNTVIVNVK